jgi:peptidoglycan/xylan/chitin deacetylase (PgdA/CDA1 family)
VRASTRRAALAVILVGAGALLAAGRGARQQSPATGGGLERRDGGIIRGPIETRRLALVFTGHEFGEGGPAILDALARSHARASFFLTGDFLRARAFQPIVRRIVREGHYLGPHSDRHLLYCAWETGGRTLISREAFDRDVEENLRAIEAFGVGRGRARYFLPAYEWYNAEIAAWSEALGLTLVNFTPGTRSNADYTGEADTGFVSSQRIVDSILARESGDPNGLNGFLLLLHIGAGPGRSDKMHDRFGGLLDELSRRQYRFVRVDDLLRWGARP